MLRRIAGHGFVRIYDSVRYTENEAIEEFINEVGYEAERTAVYDFDVLRDTELMDWVRFGK